MNIEELKRLAEAATPGPWEYAERRLMDGLTFGIHFSLVLRIEDVANSRQITHRRRHPAAILELIRSGMNCWRR